MKDGKGLKEKELCDLCPKRCYSVTIHIANSTSSTVFKRVEIVDLMKFQAWHSVNRL